ncbi:MAG: tetratricopeptide (TPR) repeat protein [Psychromonas sp.]|jgi:tetratricopeptide (TPR) repeat protein|uniref:tetratricopeptide repeat protein n=1 Tax=Psychromonas sp. TaxID=1884585 RepID=UPI0039E62BE3
MNNRTATLSFYLKTIILVLTFGIFGCSTSGQNQDSAALKTPTVEEFSKLALTAEQKGDLEQALFHYVKALEMSPTDTKLLIAIAHVHELRNDKSIASRAYLEALKIDPTLILAHQNLGIIELQDRKYKQAKIHLQQALILDQQRLSKLGGIKTSGYYDLDNESLTKSYNAAGVLEDMNGNFSLARIYYNLILNINEDFPNVLSNIGYSYYLTGALSQAENYYRKAINQDPGLKRAWTNLGLLYVRKNQYSRAIQTLKQVMSDFEAYNDLGYFVMLDGNLDEAEYFFQKAIDISPSYYKKANANLDLVRLKKRELWLAQQEAHGVKIPQSYMKMAILE